MQDHYESLMENAISSRNENYKKYVKSVYKDRYDWAHCYRKHLPIRGNNTNNYCESRFLVLKDDVLDRQKEVNVVGLLEKFTTGFDNHYSNKLLSVSSGKFDGIHSKRFKGRAKKKSEGIGFKVPTEHEQREMLSNLSTLQHNTFIVKSSTNENATYLVDMNSGFCQCKVGLNGSPCKHQYVYGPVKKQVQ